jgi:putative membrane protein
MSDPKTSDDSVLRPQVIAIDQPGERRDARESFGPRIIATAQEGRIAPAAPATPRPAAPAKPKRGRLVRKLALTALTAAVSGWLTIDVYLWVVSAFIFSPELGWAAAAVAAVGLTAVGMIVVHQMRSYFALKEVEANQQHLAVDEGSLQHTEVKEAIRNVMRTIPLDDKTKAALQTFQQQLQRHHSPAQQIEIFSQTVMPPLDRRAEAVVRRTSARAFGVTAISPTAITDALFFIALSVRMVRDIATCYGYRPSTVGTMYLVRRLVVEAGKLGVVDFAGAALTQHIGGAIAERLATGAAESVYATQRMARLGLVTMSMCRPVPFRKNEIPGIMSSLLGNLFKRTSDAS